MELTPTAKAFWGGSVTPAELDCHFPIASEEFLAAALAGSQVGTWQVDMETNLVTWDAQTSMIFGLEPVAVTTGTQLPVHADDHEQLWQALRECHRTGEQYEMVFRGLRADGEIRRLHGRGRAHPIGTDEPRYMAGTVIDVTESYASEQLRLETERQLRSIIENLPGIAYRCELDPPWRMQFISEAVSELTGYTHDDFHSGAMTWEKIMVPEDLADVSNTVSAAIAARSKYEVRYRIISRSGQIRWVLERGGAVYNEAGEPVFLEGFVGDCHEHIVALNALKETEERFRLAAQATQDTIWDWDLVTNQITWDEAISEAHGYAVEDLGRDYGWWRDRVHPDDRERVEAEVQSAVSRCSRRLVTEYRFRNADGTYADILDRAYLIKDECGRPLRLVGAMHDRTEWNASTLALRAREERLQKVFAQAIVGIMEVDAEGRVTMVNSRFCEILGRSSEEIQNLSFEDYTHPDDLSWNLALLQQGFEQGKPFQIEKRYLRPSGETVWCNVSVSFVLSSTGEVESSIVLAEDITAKKLANAALHKTELLYHSVVEATADCVLILGLDGAIEFINSPGIERLELESADELIGRPWSDLWPDEHQEIIEAALDAARDGENIRCTCSSPTAKGAPKWWDISVTPMRGANGEVEQVLAILRDNTLQKNTAESLRWASEHDALTQLPNRRAFETHLQAATLRAMQRGGNVGLLLLDLDHFKHVNDTLGHAAGDHLLSVFGKRLRESVRSRDFVARLGGDEFAIILEEKSAEANLLNAGEAIRRRLQEPLKYNGRVFSTGASIGGAMFPRDARTANDLFNNADTALYALKESGRGGTKMFHQYMREQAQLASSQLSLARTAITQKSVEPHYQQKVDLGSGKIAGFEALLRWRHHRLGFQEPATVAEAFKDYELASRIGDLMQRRVFTDMRRWLNDGLPFGFVAINAAPVEFLRDDFSERLLARMREHDIPPHLVELEITEHVFLERGSDFVGRALKVLSHAGIRIALDDFGTGYSSLSHLRDFPVDVVKIDRSFIERIELDPEIRAIVCAVIDLARSLNIDVVAEGVENEAQLTLLINDGCQLGQGFLFGRAVEADEVPVLLQRRDYPGRMVI